jgi:urease accessory protein
VYLASLGGGLVDGDHLTVRVDAGEATTSFLGTQASTKVYRSPRGCSQRLEVRVAAGAAVAIAPDPVVCFAGARYQQATEVWLAGGASVVLVDGYTSGRAARGERWQFAQYSARTIVRRASRSAESGEAGGQAGRDEAREGDDADEGWAPAVVDATRLDPAHGSVAARMGPFDAVVTVLAMGPRFAVVRDALLGAEATPAAQRALCAASALGPDAAILRVAADCFERASHVLRPSFSALARVLGDDPFARKW